MIYAFDESFRATYSPEDNKIRLYVGRVPRPEYDALRSEGWTATPKQSCDFAAHWTPQHRDTALQYAGSIDDEDMGPDERAADRAERFSGYLGKRLGEAAGKADAFEAGPSVFGFQNQARADLAAARHDRIADKACDAWGKAEYWQRRTAGVISHALYSSRPDVRMGRIKVLESELRQMVQRWEQSGQQADGWAADWKTHLELRLAYENQMLEAQGGRLAHVEIEVGGTMCGLLIMKVNKSNATGRVVSVLVRDNHASNCNHYGNLWADGIPKFLSHTVETERMAPGAYTPPTDEGRAKLAALKAEKKAGAPAKEPCPLINPTDADAQHLQDELNAHSLADHCRRHLHIYGKDYASDYKPSTICRTTQSNYSAASAGTYGRAETRGLCKGAEIEPSPSNMWCASAKSESERRGPAACKIRVTQADGSDYGAKRVIILTDKPQKSLPTAVWEKVEVIA